MGVIVLTANWLDDNNSNNNDDGKDPVRAQLKQLEKQNKDLMEKLKTAETSARNATIKDVLTDKGKPAKLAKLIPSDIEATPEAIEKWLEEYADLFGTPTNNTSTDGTNSGDNNSQGAQGGKQVDQEYVDAMNAALRVAQVTNGGKPVQSKPEDLMKQLADPNLKPEELIKLIEQHGGGTGVG